MSRRRFLDRTHKSRERRRRDGRGFNPVGMFKLAGFGAAILIFIAVYLGFHRQDETLYEGPWGILERLTTPLFFGVNALELIAIIIVAAIAWRIWQKMKTG
jgi:hypothetical protein